MMITNKLKERFVRDYKIPIRIYTEPYFSDRLNLYDKQFGTLSKWTEFIAMLDKYENEEAYLADYNRVKDDAINFIKNTDAYKEFNELDMNQFAITHKNLPAKDIYHSMNIGKQFISIDMKKANFNALRHYNAKMFDNSKTWEEFIGMFTDNDHIKNSKYIREVILGNCNPKRHITYEKYLMDNILTELEKIITYPVVFFSNDEIIFDVTNCDTSNITIPKFDVPVRVEKFTLQGIRRNDAGTIIGYVRKISNGEMDFKCLNSLTFPFVLRHVNNEVIVESDTIFEYEGMLSKFICMPDLSIIDTMQ